MVSEELKQNTFKEITGTSECEAILKRAAELGSHLQIKIGDDSLIVLKTIAYQNGSLLAEYVEGLDPVSAEVDVVFEAEKQWYGATALFSAQSSQAPPVYAIAISKLFEIQRREVFRVGLNSDIIKASFKMTDLNKSFSLTDLSEKGFALLVPLEEATTLTADSEHPGSLTVEPREPISLSIKVVRIIETNDGIKAGCEIINANPATHQKIATIVNECHRLLFGKMT